MGTQKKKYDSQPWRVERLVEGKWQFVATYSKWKSMVEKVKELYIYS